MNTQRGTIVIRNQRPEVSMSAISSGVALAKTEARATAGGQGPEFGIRRPSSGLQPTAYSPQPGFTLMELLVVIAIIALLLGIIVPSYFSIREKAKYTKAKVTVKNLETAFKAYLDHYRVWPDLLKEDEAVEIKDDVFKMLRGDAGVLANPDAIAFYEFESTNSSLLVALDPFTDSTTPAVQRNYLVQVDKNYDNKITVGGQDIYRTVIVWSVGTNRSDALSEPATKEGNVRSWD